MKIKTRTWWLPYTKVKEMAGSKHNPRTQVELSPFKLQDTLTGIANEIMSSNSFCLISVHTEWMGKYPCQERPRQLTTL